MTRIDFYIIEAGSRDNRYSLACRLADKIFHQGHLIYLYTSNEADARHLDRLLWTFRDQSFLPHELASPKTQNAPPILIGWQEAPASQDDVLINLAPEVPEFFSRFARVAEPLDSDTETRRAGRDRFRFYRDRGYPLHTHKIR